MTQENETALLDEPTETASEPAPKMSFDIEDLTLGEVSEIERISGQSIKSLSKGNAPQGITMAAIVMVVKRRTEGRSFSLIDAQKVTLKEFSLILGDDDDTPKKGKKKSKK